MNTKHLMEGAKGQGFTEKIRKQRKARESFFEIKSAEDKRT